MMPQTIGRAQREAVKAAIQQYGWGGQTLLARIAGISKPTLNIWLATGRGLSQKRVARVIRCVDKLLGINSSLAEKQQANQRAKGTSFTQNLP